MFEISNFLYMFVDNWLRLSVQKLLSLRYPYLEVACFKQPELQQKLITSFGTQTLLTQLNIFLTTISCILSNQKFLILYTTLKLEFY